MYDKNNFDKLLKFEDWDGKSLKGLWNITRKIDGIQARQTAGINNNKFEFQLFSKGGKVLNNVKTKKNFELAEVYTGKLEDVFSILMASKSKRRPIKESEIYPLYPILDPRLFICARKNPTAAFIQKTFLQEVEAGYEGLVLRQGNRCIKVKPSYTIDVKILGVVEGTGKHANAVKDFITEKGKVGIGLSEAQRKEFFKKKYIGTFIEVKCMGLTKNNKFRHPRFIRLRPDK